MIRPALAALALALSTGASAAETLPGGRLLGPFDALQSSAGFSASTLRDPVGFDVARDVHLDGHEVGDDGLLGLSGRLAFTWHAPLSGYSSLRARFTTALDTSDYVGLNLVSLDGSAGLSLERRTGWLGASMGVSVGAGLTRTETFFEETLQPLAQAGVHVQIELGRFVVEWVAYERVHGGRELDGRTAAPRVGTRALMIGWRMPIGANR